MSKEDFVGVWKLVSFTVHRSSGEVSHPWGHALSGRLMYEPSGYMAVQLMRADRPLFASDQIYGGTAEEKLAAYESLITYFGTYQVDTEAGTVSHHVESSSFPNWAGSSQLRFYELTPDSLTLSPPPVKTSYGSRRSVLVWERIA